MIDVDPNGLDWWGKLLERDSEIRQAVERAYQVRTPRGGLHVYFKGEGPYWQAELRKASTRVEELTGTVASCRAVMSCFPDLRLAPDYSVLPVEPLIHRLLYCPRLFPSARKQIRLDNKIPDGDQPRNINWALGPDKAYVSSGHVSVQGARRK